MAPRLAWRTPLSASLRLGWAIVALALLAALAIGAALVASQRPSAEEIVARSQAVFRSPPPFAMTTRYPGGSEARYRYDGTTLRVDVLVAGYAGRLGHYRLRDERRIAEYDPAAPAWNVTEMPTGGATADLDPSWAAPVTVAAEEQPALMTCDAWELGEAAEIAGRPTDAVRCGDDRFWVDRESGMLLKRLTTTTFAPTAEVVSLDLDPDLDPALFAFEPPAGTAGPDTPLALRPRSPVLSVGATAPTWVGTTLDLELFSSDDLLGRPAAVFIWCGCAWGPQARLFLEEARDRGGTMHFAFVSVEAEGTTRGLVDWVGANLPVVQDSNASVVDSWQLDRYPALVLLRPDGTVADVHPATFTQETLRAILDALASGGTIPEPLPPVPPDAAFDDDTWVLEVGAVAPELRGPRLGGGEASTRDLVGRRSVVVAFVPPHADGTPRDDSPLPDALLEAAAAHGDEIEVLLLADGEPTTGAAHRYVDRQRTDVPLIFDWDGTLKERWGLWRTPTVVLLEADGRVAGVYGSDVLRDPSRVIDAFVRGQPVPSSG